MHIKIVMTDPMKGIVHLVLVRHRFPVCLHVNVLILDVFVMENLIVLMELTSRIAQLIVPRMNTLVWMVNV